MRTFIELELPVDVGELVRRRQHDVRDTLAEHGLASCFRWTQISGIHLTLRFLGETTTAQERMLASALQLVAQEWTPLALSAGKVGAFPSAQRPRVLWLAVGGDLDGLRKLQAHVEKTVQDCGFEAESRPYAPHLTIARIRRDCPQGDTKQAGVLLAQFVMNAPQLTPEGRFTADTMIHMRSDLRFSGAEYTPLSTHRLTG